MNAYGSSEILEGYCEEAENLKLYSSKHDGMLFLVGDVTVLAAFDELIDLQKLLLSTNDSRWENLNMTLGQYCWFDHGGDSFTTGFPGQRFSPYWEGLNVIWRLVRTS